MKLIRFLKKLLLCARDSVVGEIEILPDGPLVDILLRLPAKDIFNCRRVCRRWRALTSTRRFVEDHVKHSPATRFLQLFDPTDKDSLDLFVLEGQAAIMKAVGGGGGIIREMRGGRPKLLGSLNGLLLFQCTQYDDVYGICNPVLQESVTFRAPFPGGRMCGFFPDPSTEDYKLLCFQDKVWHIGKLSDMSWRELHGPDRAVPQSDNTALMSNSHLHWMAAAEPWTDCSESIIMFNTKTESFSSMPHPGRECHSRECHKEMWLLEEADKGLSFCVILNEQLFIWDLEDHHNWDWVQKYKIDLELDIDVFLHMIQDNELLVHRFNPWDDKLQNIECYNLKTKQMRELKVYSRHDECEWLGCIYSKSLVSPKLICASHLTQEWDLHSI